MDNFSLSMLPLRVLLIILTLVLVVGFVWIFSLGMQVALNAVKGRRLKLVEWWQEGGSYFLKMSDDRVYRQLKDGIGVWYEADTGRIPGERLIQEALDSGLRLIKWNAVPHLSRGARGELVRRAGSGPLPGSKPAEEDYFEALIKLVEFKIPGTKIRRTGTFNFDVGYQTFVIENFPVDSGGFVLIATGDQPRLMEHFWANSLDDLTRIVEKVQELIGESEGVEPKPVDENPTSPEASPFLDLPFQVRDWWIPFNEAYGLDAPICTAIKNSFVSADILVGESMGDGVSRIIVHILNNTFYINGRHGLGNIVWPMHITCATPNRAAIREVSTIPQLIRAIDDFVKGELTASQEGARECPSCHQALSWSPGGQLCENQKCPTFKDTPAF